MLSYDWSILVMWVKYSFLIGYVWIVLRYYFCIVVISGLSFLFSSAVNKNTNTERTKKNLQQQSEKHKGKQFKPNIRDYFLKTHSCCHNTKYPYCSVVFLVLMGGEFVININKGVLSLNSLNCYPLQRIDTTITYYNDNLDDEHQWSFLDSVNLSSDRHY